MISNLKYTLALFVLLSSFLFIHANNTIQEDIEDKITNIQSSCFTLSPNPATIDVTVKFNLSIYNQESVIVQIYSPVGKIIEELILDRYRMSDNITVSVKGYDPGYYTVRAIVNGTVCGTETLMVKP